MSGGEWERGLFRLILEHTEVFHRLPGYARREVIAAHMRHATNLGYPQAVLDEFLAP